MIKKNLVSGEINLKWNYTETVNEMIEDIINYIKDCLVDDLEDSIKHYNEIREKIAVTIQ